MTLKVLTGDNELVTTKICREEGLEPGVPVMGRNVEQMSVAELREVAEETTIFAKLTTLQKIPSTESVAFQWTHGWLP